MPARSRTSRPGGQDARRELNGQGTGTHASSPRRGHEGPEAKSRVTRTGALILLGVQASALLPHLQAEYDAASEAINTCASLGLEFGEVCRVYKATPMTLEQAIRHVEWHKERGESKCRCR